MEDISLFYTKEEVCAHTKLSRATIDRLEAKGNFPRRLNLTGAHRGKVVWWKTSVHEWCEARSQRMLKPPSDSPKGGSHRPPA